jgi:hypothetical protein
MNKNDLIFDWSGMEAHRGWTGVSVLVVAMGFGLMFSLFNVRFDHKDIATVKSASVLYLPDGEEGRIWRMKAEEEGPFPGGLEIMGMHDPLEKLGVGLLDDDESWNPYRVTMKPLETDSSVSRDRISVQGQRVYPRNFKSSNAVKRHSKNDFGLSPVLLAYNKEAEAWLPSGYSTLQVEMKDVMASAEWIFVLSLAADGKVVECLPLEGGDAAGSAALIAWLKGLSFQKSEEPERWLGLRIEFSNERIHGTGSE